MLSMLVPLYALYEIAVVAVRFMESRRAKASTDLTTKT
jgi:Sec-independent protein secretion pathway component TatC